MSSWNQDDYITEAIESAAATLLWQATDITDAGHGFPVSEGGNEYSAQVIEQVPGLAEAVTAFVRDNWNLLLRGRVEAGQCGHDFILTAGHHGAGFWDRGLDMPATDDVAYAAWLVASERKQPGFYLAWLKEYRPYPADYPASVGDALTKAAHGYEYALDAEFALDADGDVAWLMVMNTVLVNVPCPDCGGTLTEDESGHKPACTRDSEGGAQ
jgi:hypothetical protein